MIGTYILHFDRPLTEEEKWVQPFYGDQQHYIGFSNELDKRLAKHMRGGGSVITRKVFLLGIPMKIGRILENLNLEEGIEEAYMVKDMCHICNP